MQSDEIYMNVIARVPMINGTFEETIIEMFVDNEKLHRIRLSIDVSKSVIWLRVSAIDFSIADRNNLHRHVFESIWKKGKKPFLKTYILQRFFKKNLHTFTKTPALIKLRKIEVILINKR